MTIIEKDNYLIVSSYPVKLAWLCLLIVFATLYCAFILPTTLSILLAGIILPTVLLFAVDYKLTLFDIQEQKILFNRYSVFGLKKQLIDFTEITNIKTEQVNGFKQASRYLCLVTPSHDFAITTATDASSSQLSLLARKINTLLDKTVHYH